MNADSISGIPHLHFILSILSKDSPTTFNALHLIGELAVKQCLRLYLSHYVFDAFSRLPSVVRFEIS